MKKNRIRALLYLLGMCTLALGLTLSTKADLGVSPIISVSFGVSKLSGVRFGDTTLALYSAFVLAELALHLLPGRRSPENKRRLVLTDLLQLPLSLAFTRLVNLFSALLPVPEGIVLRVLILLLSVVLVGTGAALSLNMRVIPNPGDGIVQAVSDRSGLDLGLVKNIVDIGCVALTCALTLLIARQLEGVGPGTVVGMFGTGRVIALFNRFFGKRIGKAAGI